MPLRSVESQSLAPDRRNEAEERVPVSRRERGRPARIGSFDDTYSDKPAWCRAALPPATGPIAATEPTPESPVHGAPPCSPAIHGRDSVFSLSTKDASVDTGTSNRPTEK